MSFEASLISLTSKHSDPIETMLISKQFFAFTTRLGKPMNIYTYDFGGIDSYGTIY